MKSKKQTIVFKKGFQMVLELAITQEGGDLRVGIVGERGRGGGRDFNNSIGRGRSGRGRQVISRKDSWDAKIINGEWSYGGQRIEFC